MNNPRLKVSTPISQAANRLAKDGRKAGLDIQLKPDRVKYRGTQMNGMPGRGSFANDIDAEGEREVRHIWRIKFGIWVILALLLIIIVLL